MNHRTFLTMQKRQKSRLHLIARRSKRKLRIFRARMNHRTLLTRMNLQTFKLKVEVVTNDVEAFLKVEGLNEAVEVAAGVEVVTTATKMGTRPKIVQTAAVIVVSTASK